MIGRGVSKIYELIGGGQIRAVKSDGRTLVVVESLREYADKLPKAIVAPPPFPRQRRSASAGLRWCSVMVRCDH